MSIDWGGYNGHLRVGIDHTISPSSPSHSDTTVNVTWKFYVGTDGWNFSGDVQYLHEGADGWGGTTTTFTNNLSSGDMLVDTKTVTYSIDYTNSGSKSANANLTGAYNGATPSHSVSVNLPERPIATPSAGEAPQAQNITSTGVTISWGYVTDNGGDPIDKYELQISTNNGFTNVVYDNANEPNPTPPITQAVTGLNPSTQYYARLRAHNSAGWGAWTDPNYCPFTTLAGTPSKPGTPVKTSSTQTSITVGWSASNSNGGGTVTYTLDRSTDSTFATGVTTITTTSTNYTASGLTAGTTYYFRVKATNSLGSSGETATLTAATNPALTYNDSGDYVTLVNNLASAVADKLIHLGMTRWTGARTASTIPTGTDTYVTMGTDIAKRGPSAHWPSVTQSGSAEFTINYPGTYEIEFFYRMDESGAAFRWNQNIYINGSYLPAYSPNPPGPKGGVVVGYESYQAAATAPGRLVKITRHLDVGDTVGFGVWQNSGSSKGQPAPVTGDLYSWAKLTLVGFQ